MEINYALDHISDAAKAFWDIASDYHVIVLNGNLGAGKTTFVRALCHYLGVKELVSSPTFSIINEYTFIGRNGRLITIYHSDWYRLGSEEEAIEAGIEDMLRQKEDYCIVEWPERAPGLLPGRLLTVDFHYVDEQTRMLALRPEE